MWTVVERRGGVELGHLLFVLLLDGGAFGACDSDGSSIGNLSGLWFVGCSFWLCLFSILSDELSRLLADRILLSGSGGLDHPAFREAVLHPLLLLAFVCLAFR